MFFPKAVKACPVKILPEQLATVATAAFKKELLYKVKAREVSSKLDEVLTLCALLIDATSSDEACREKEEIKLLVRFLKEQREYDADAQSWKAKKPKKGECSGNLQSAHDPDATCRVKRDEVYIGYVANIAETCTDENDVQLITDYTLEKNNVEDNTMANESIPRMQATFQAEELYVDGGYSSERVHDTAEENGISMFHTNMTGAAPVAPGHRVHLLREQDYALS